MKHLNQRSNRNFKNIILGLIVFLVAMIGVAGFYIFGNKNISNERQRTQDISTTPSNDVELSQESIATFVIPDKWIEYKNIELGFSFAYPQKYGEVEVSSTYGTEGEHGRLITFNFTKLCDACEPEQVNIGEISMSSPGLIEMGAMAPDFGGWGTSRPIAGMPWGAGYIKNSDGTVSSKWALYWKSQDLKERVNYPIFQGINIDGLLIQQQDDFHDLFKTSVVFNLKHSEIQGFEFMTHDEIGEKNNAENLKSIAKTFRLLD